MKNLGIITKYEVNFNNWLLDYGDKFDSYNIIFIDSYEKLRGREFYEIFGVDDYDINLYNIALNRVR